ncbi:MAG TPA: copper resistance protein NlpE N-terminal domain-containing protein [Saprospiraceae bacterium]|nr:copper resistance protein NlpE N-terminal domain-containing protein [Saprospiraceae bacterium]HRO07792.1 copper resistance protein NlpE N-terminal domain-containing protein [Saprospiraceae bacterium]
MLKTNFKSLLFLLSGIILLASCNNKANPEANQPLVDEHTAQNSLDWNGSYYGILPCADCEGIETELTLNNDNTYSLTSKYMGKEKELADTISGKFAWEGNNIKLDGIEPGTRSAYFKIEENQVKYLDLEGKEVAGELAPFYTMKKTGNPNVEDKRWKLVELNGKPVKGNAETHFLILHADKRQAQAKANCNVLILNYRITNELAIRFDQGISTLMACPDGLEDEYVKVLSTVDNLSVSGDRLTLNKARMAPLAVFELVK